MGEDKIITKENNKIICPECGYSEEIPNNTFNYMLEFPWVSFLAGMGEITKIVLICPKCKHKAEQHFIF